ncbi:ATP-dependent Clp protease ATP-binding subunit [Staphylococcus xylosus]|uniref:AAA family ATPase n=1 Tax=Staphylococcus xylosus TaxID=1288 RepID=UPI000E69F4F7|nr:AAA family ATPase [Staphylococcus xylosus]RIM88892.1 ATP-dependent Clp protease ATP-binding subunit [Staphylococcus xylosus]
MYKLERLNEDEKQYFLQMNVEFGNSLSYLSLEENEVIGRELELKNLSYIMRKRKKPVAMLTGDAGTGKTQLVEIWAKRQAEKNVHLLTLNIGALNPAEHKNRVSTLLPKLKEYEDYLKRNDNNASVVLFIDEFHNIISNFAFPSKEGGDLLKPTLGRAGEYIRVIAATTYNEFDAYVSSDKPLKRRFEPLPINEVSYEQTIKILKNWIKNEKGEEFAGKVDESIYERIVTANKMYTSDLAEPSKSIDVLELMLAMYEEDHSRGITETKMDYDLVEKVFNFTKNVDLHFNVDFSAAGNHLRKKIRGQPFVLRAMDIALKRMAFGLRKYENQPLFTALLVGTSGVGKTETVKQLTQAIYGDQSRLIIIPMTSYNTPESAELFRRRLGTAVRKNPSCVVLLDELEKAHDNVILSLLPVLDEGEVEFYERSADGYDLPTPVSMKNTMIFATTNKGHEIFEEINSAAHEIIDMKQEDLDVVTKEIERLFLKIKPEIETGLKDDNFRPELLQRFKNIVPFSTLTRPALLDICYNKLKETQILFKKRGYTIKINKPIDWTNVGYPWIANDICMFVVLERLPKEDAGAAGARRINSILEDEVESKILDVILDEKYKDYSTFILKTDENVRFKNTDDATPNGNIIIEAVS